MENLHLFIIENNELVVNSADILTSKYLKQLYERTKTSTDDPSGKLKHRNIQELAFIYQMYHYEAHVFRNGLSWDKAVDYAREIVGLPNKWMPDEIVIRAGEEYEQSILSVEHLMVKNLHMKYYKSIRMLDMMEEIINTELEKDDLDLDSIGKLDKYHTKLNDQSVQVKKIMNDIKKLRRDIESGAGGNEELLRGANNKTIPHTAIPGKDFTDNITEDEEKNIAVGIVRMKINIPNGKN